MRPSSPVRERAAIFENLASFRENLDARPRSPPPRAHLHDKEGWSKIPHHYPTREEEAKMHRAKFGQSISEPRPVVVESSDDTERTYDTAHQTFDDGLPTGQSPPPSESRRAPSRGWPVQVRTSSKTGVSHPQPFHQAATPDKTDAHNPPHRLSIVTQRIAQLALAGLEDVPRSQSRPTSVTATDPDPGKDRESELRNHNMDGGLLLPRRLPHLQLPMRREADGVLLVPDSSIASEPMQSISRGYSQGRSNQRTPIAKSYFEKQAISLSRSPVKREDSESPVTPLRGRSKVARTPRGSGYGVEQSFYFSPRKSRSPSRGSGRRLTLQINLGTPDRQSMEKVMIKADMDVLEEA